MNVDLLEVLSGTLTPTAVLAISRHLGESETAVRSGISALFAPLLAGFGAKATTSAGASSVYAMLMDPEVNPTVVDSLEPHLNPHQSAALRNTGRAMLARLFGADRLSGLGPALAQISGLRNSSATSLAMIVAPIVFGTLRKVVDEHGLDVTSTAALLTAQQSVLTDRAEPTLTSALGIGMPSDRVARPAPTAAASGHSVMAAPGPRNFDLSVWLAVIIGLPIAIVLMGSFVRTIGTRAPVTVPAASLAASSPDNVMLRKASGRSPI
jgi:hypothetical protein